MRKISSPPVPHEHGAWAMFLVPLIIGSGVGFIRTSLSNDQSRMLFVALFAGVSFCFFLLRYPLMLLVKVRTAEARSDALRWSGVYGLLAGVGGVTLVVITQLWWLIVLGLLGIVTLAIYLGLVMRREEMTVMGEWTGIAGAALAAPGAYLVATRVLDITAVALCLACILFFGGTVYHIKFKVREQLRVTSATSDWRARLFAARAPIVYSFMSVLAAIVLVLIGWLPVLTIIAFVLPICKVLFGALDRPTRLSLPRLGVIEVVYSALFMLIFILAYR